jgi:hypothetical protein
MAAWLRHARQTGAETGNDDTTTTTPTRLGRRGQGPWSRRARSRVQEQTVQTVQAGGTDSWRNIGAGWNWRAEGGRVPVKAPGWVIRRCAGRGPATKRASWRGLASECGVHVGPGETPLRNCVAVAKAGKGSQRGRQASMSSVKRQASGGKRQASTGERRASSIHRGCWPGSSRAAVEANPSLRGGRRRRWREWCKR